MLASDLMDVIWGPLLLPLMSKLLMPPYSWGGGREEGKIQEFFLSSVAFAKNLQNPDDRVESTSARYQEIGIFYTKKGGWKSWLDLWNKTSDRELDWGYWKLEKNWENGTFFRINERAAYTNFSKSLRKIMEMSNLKEFFIGKIYVNIYVLSIPKGHPSIVIFNDTFFITFSVHIFLISQTIKRTCLQKLLIKINI